jgi:hypothetical protein
MIDRWTAGRMRILPIKAELEELKLPPWLSAPQHVELGRLGNPTAIVPLVEERLSGTPGAGS